MRKSAVFFFTLMVVGAPLAGPADPDAFARRVEIKGDNSRAIKLAFDLSQVERQTTEKEGSEFESFRLEGEGFTYVPGMPILPAVSRMVVVPPAAGLELVVEADTPRHLRAVNPPPLCDEEGLPEVVAANVRTGLNGLYPPVVAEMSEPFIIRGVRLVRVTTYPVQYDPAAGSFIRHERVNAEVRFTDAPPVNPSLYPIRRHRSPTFLKFIRGFAVNGDEVGRDDPDYDADPDYVGHYLVVINVNCLRYAAPFIEWRRKAGYKVDILSLSAGDAGNSGTVKTRIHDRYQAYLDQGVDPFDYIMLIGDHESYDDVQPAAQWILAAAHGSPSWNGNQGNHFDWDYACMDGGNDAAADVGISRWIAGSVEMLGLNVGKTLSYEMNPYFQDTRWFRRGAVYGQRWSGSWHVSLHTNVRWGVEVLDRLGFNDIRHYEDMNRVESGGEGVGPFIREQFNAGVNVMCGRAENYFFRYNLDGVNDNVTFPIDMDVAGHHEWTCWHYLRTGDANHLKGPVAATTGWGNGGNATLPFNIVWLEMVNGFLLRDLPYGWSRLQGVMGPAQYIPNFLQTFSFITTDIVYYGDPALQPWIGVPRVVRADYTTEVTPTTRRVDVRVVADQGGDPVEGATVTLYFPGSMPAFDNADYAGYNRMQMWTRKSDADGVATFTFDDGVRFIANTRMYCTVSGRNIKPFLADRTIGTPRASLEVSAYELTDEQGNGDGELNPGEQFSLFLTAKNVGNGNAVAGVAAMLSSTSPNIHLEAEEIYFGDIEPGAEAQGDRNAIIHLAPSCPDGVSRPGLRPIINVEFHSGEQVWQSAIHLEPRAPHFEVRQVIGGNVVPDSATRIDIEITNVGSVPSADISARLRSLGMGITVIGNETFYRALAPGRSGRIEGDRFLLSGNRVVVPGTKNPMQIIITTESGFVDTASFVLQVMQPRARAPQGPDAYGYICFDDGDTGWTMAPAYDWVEIDGRAQDAEFEGTQLRFQGNSPLDIGEALLVGLPFTTQFYGVEYDTITVATNGFISMGNQRNITNFQNWPLDRSIGGGVGMIAPLWDQLALGQNGRVYTYFDEDSGRFVIEWSRLRAYAGGQNDLTFQVILRDMSFPPWITLSGDPNIVIQYKTVENVQGGGNAWTTDTPFASVGISSPNGNTGISYTWNNQYPVTSLRLENRRALLFSTSPRYRSCLLFGRVSDNATGAPIEEAVIYTNHGFIAYSDFEGYWRIVGALAEVPFWIKCSKQGYNDSTYYNLQVAEDDSLEILYELLHPEFTLSMESLSAALEADQEIILPFTLTNTGNGALTWRGEKRLIGDANAEPWELRRAYAAGRVLNDDRLEGVVFARDNFFVCGANGNDTNLVYTLDRDGALLDTMLQFGTSRYGYKDLDWDGELLWGSGEEYVYGFTPDGNLVYSWDGPLNPTNYIAWDSDRNLLWLSGTTTNIYPCDIEGRVLDQPLRGLGLRIYGLAYWPEDPDGYTLYILNQPANSPPLVHKMNPVTGDTLRVFTLPLRGATSFNAAWITNQFDVYSWVMMTLANAAPDSGSDRLEIYQLEARKDWMELDTYSGGLQTGEVHDFTLTLNSTGLPDTLFRGEMFFRHNADDGVARVAVELNVFGPLPPEPFGLVEPAQDDTLTALPLHGDTLNLPGLVFRWERARDPNRADAVRYQFHIGVADSERSWGWGDTTLTLNLDTLRLPFWFDRPIVWWVDALSGPDRVPCREPFRLHILPNAADRDRFAAPVEFALSPVYPNPFNARTTVRYSLDRAGPSSLKLFDLAGRLVMVLHDGETPAGVYRLALDGSELPSGVYWVRLESRGRTKVQKMALVR